MWTEEQIQDLINSKLERVAWIQEVLKNYGVDSQSRQKYQHELCRLKGAIQALGEVLSPYV